METQTTELTYDPYAEIVINDAVSYYSELLTKKISASDATTAVRNNKLNQTKIVNFEKTENDVKDYLIENFDDFPEHATEIANLLQMDLSKTVEVSLDVTVKLTLLLPMGTTMDEIGNYDFEIQVNSLGSFDIEEFDYDVNDVREL